MYVENNIFNLSSLFFTEQLLVYGKKPAASVGTVTVREADRPAASAAAPQGVWERRHAGESYKVNKGGAEHVARPYYCLK